MRIAMLVLGVALPGLGAVAVSGYFLLRDWAALAAAFTALESAVKYGTLEQITRAQALDSVYRINCFADGVGVMLGLVVLAIGIHGLCLLPRAPERRAGTP
jgi:hypothetical protein